MFSRIMASFYQHHFKELLVKMFWQTVNYIGYIRNHRISDICDRMRWFYQEHVENWYIFQGTYGNAPLH